MRDKFKDGIFSGIQNLLKNPLEAFRKGYAYYSIEGFLGFDVHEGWGESFGTISRSRDLKDKDPKKREYQDQIKPSDAKFKISGFWTSAKPKSLKVSAAAAWDGYVVEDKLVYKIVLGADAKGSVDIDFEPPFLSKNPSVGVRDVSLSGSAFVGLEFGGHLLKYKYRFLQIETARSLWNDFMSGEYDVDGGKDTEMTAAFESPVIKVKLLGFNFIGSSKMLKPDAAAESGKVDKPPRAQITPPGGSGGSGG